MTTRSEIKKPSVMGIVIIGSLIALAPFYYGGIFLIVLLKLQTDPTLDGGLWGDPATVAAVTKQATLIVVEFAAVGVLYLLVVLLISRYKRIGLILAVIVYGISLLWGIYNLVIGSRDLLILFIVLTTLAALYYVRVYLTREPEKSFFT